MEGQIYKLIGKAMDEIGAITKDSVNKQQGFKYRGIDAVYNALNPVLRKNGLFITPEVLDHKREERQTNNGGRLIYSILTMKYTMFAPDGSSVSAVVIGEGMDSGDKASNKAMSVAMKYAMFQIFCIPTEEMIDPDSEVQPESRPAPAAPKPTPKPQPKPAVQPEKRPDVMGLIKAFCEKHGITGKQYQEYRMGVIRGGIVKAKKYDEMTEQDVRDLNAAILMNCLGSLSA